MKLLLTIFFAVFLATLSSSVIHTYWVTYSAEVALEKATLELERQNAEAAREFERQRAGAAEISRHSQEENKIKLAANQKRLAQKAHIKKRNREVCEFWKEQYKNTRESYDESMMITACKHSGQM